MVLFNENFFNLRHLNGDFCEKFLYFALKFWRFHGFHTEITEVSPLLLLNYQFMNFYGLLAALYR